MNLVFIIYSGMFRNDSRNIVTEDLWHPHYLCEIRAIKFLISGLHNYSLCFELWIVIDHESQTVDQTHKFQTMCQRTQQIAHHRDIQLVQSSLIQAVLERCTHLQEFHARKLSCLRNETWCPRQMTTLVWLCISSLWQCVFS